MPIYPRKYTFIVLGATSLLCSRLSFTFIDDSEGPNLLIVTVLAVLLFAISIFTFRYTALKTPYLTKLILAIVIQVTLAIVSGICFK